MITIIRIYGIISTEILVNGQKTSYISPPGNPILYKPRTVASIISSHRHCEIKRRQMPKHLPSFYGAGDEARTRYLHLGKVALYRMSYTRGTRHIITDSLNLSTPFSEILHLFLRPEKSVSVNSSDRQNNPTHIRPFPRQTTPQSSPAPCCTAGPHGNRSLRPTLHSMSMAHPTGYR